MLAGWLAGWQAGWQAGRQAGRQADRQTDRAAASRREERKKARYDRERYPGGLSVKVTPLVLEHFGRWGKQGEEYLDQLSKRSTDDFGRPNRAEFKDNWRKRFAIQL